VAHKMLTLIYHMLLRQEHYKELGADYLDSLSQHVRERKLVKQVEALGYEVRVKSTSNE
jgi:transposase